MKANGGQCLVTSSPPMGFYKSFSYILAKHFDHHREKIDKQYNVYYFFVTFIRLITNAKANEILSNLD